MNPDTRMAISLLLSLAVSAPNLRMAAGGDADIVTVGLRYVVAFVIAFVTVGAVGRVFADYVHGPALADDADRPPASPAVEAARSEPIDPFAPGAQGA